MKKNKLITKDDSTRYILPETAASVLSFKLGVNTCCTRTTKIIDHKEPEAIAIDFIMGDGQKSTHWLTGVHKVSRIYLQMHDSKKIGKSFRAGIPLDRRSNR